ncbi:hypothetical protein P7C70_g7910, partial [Phenoliferia sp. Uapishka_3]
MSSTPSLPPELLFQIFETFATVARKLDLPTGHYQLILTLCLVSKHFRDIAQPLLHVRIHLRKQSSALKLLASQALGLHRVEELDLTGNVGARVDGLTAVTATAVVQAAGRLGLKNLKLGRFKRLSSTVVELAGAGKGIPSNCWFMSFLISELSDLESLDLQTNFNNDNPPPRWSFPFRLLRLGVHGWVYSLAFMSALLASSTSITSLEYTSTTLFNVFSLPEFPSFARQITSLVIQTESEVTPGSFSNFSAVTHLTTNCSIIWTIKELLEAFPVEAATITHWTLPLTFHFFESEVVRDEWETLNDLKQLGALEVITFKSIGSKYSHLVPKIRVRGREVRMEFEG